MPQQADTTQGGAPATPDTQDQQQRADGATPPATAAAPAPDLVKRHSEIIALCVREKVADKAADFIARGLTPEQVGLAILNERASSDEASGGHMNARSVQTVRDEFKTRMEGITEALMQRLDVRAKLTDNGRQYRGMTLQEIGRDMLERGGVSTRGMTRMELAGAMLQHRSGAYMGTSDFGFITANIANKRLSQAYEEHAGTYAMWARRAPNAPDFKQITVGKRSGMPSLVKVNEHGEFKTGSISDGAETYAAATYGIVVPLTRQAIVNDDLRVFDDMLTGFGDASARLENELVYAQLLGNPAMADGTTVFHASRNNLATGGGSALSQAALGSGRSAMRLQKGLGGERLNLSPAVLLVPTALEQTAYSLTSANYVPAKQSDINEFRAGGRTALEPIVDPLLDDAAFGGSATAWYLLANRGVGTVEYCWVDGAEGPVIDTEVGFDVDGIRVRCREDFAAKVTDFRGLYKAAGA